MGKYLKLPKFYDKHKQLINEYDEKEIHKLNNELTNKQWSYYKVKGADDKYLAFKCLYICRFKLNYTTKQIASLFGQSQRTIQELLKKVNWNRTREQAQQLAANVSRDYKEIHTKANKTRLKNRAIGKGSEAEEYIRTHLKNELDALEWEVIVGCSTLSILGNGREVDIPIIVFLNNKMFKFAIEVNGKYWHDADKQAERDQEKIKELKNKGYTPFVIEVDTQNESQITARTNEVIKDIKSKVIM